MSPSLVHAHDSRIHFKLDDVADDIRGVTVAVLQTGDALDHDDLAAARLKTIAIMERVHEIAEDVAILREMLRVR